MKDPYKVLGLDKSATPEEIKSKYDELHAKYGEQRFMSGEEGNEGARLLQELEEAWVLISADLSRESEKKHTTGDVYSDVDNLIRQGKYDEAQSMLDSVQDRSAEWHYMQAIIFYKREWLSDSKTQLEMAIREDPSNSKYRSSLDKLNMTIGGKNAQQAAQPNQGYGGANNPPPYNDYGGQPQQDMGNCLSSCCCAYCLTDCLCNMMRCC